MSDGDDDPAAEDESAEDDAPDAEETDDVDYELDVDTFEDRFDDVADAFADADTEADLDDIETTLDAIADDLEAADLPEPDDDDEPPPREAFEDRLAELRDQLDDERGPYPDDVIDAVEAVQDTIQETRWTDTGLDSVETAVADMIDTSNDALDTDLDTPTGDADALATGLDPVVDAIDDADLDPDADAATLDTLTDTVDSLAAAVDDAEQWDDLTIRDQLQAQGFYDALGEKHKDFPPEWTAIQEWENQGNADMILLALSEFDSDFMERHCLESLERLGDPDAIDAMHERAERRNRPAIRILGKIGVPDDDVVDTLLEYVGTESDPALQKVTMKALGEMGATDAVQPIADQLHAENRSVRSRAARALGLLGDPRAIDPLTDVVETDTEDSVRASAAWALVQIGTEPALDAAADYADDDAYVVQAEAEPAASAVGDTDAPPA